MTNQGVSSDLHILKCGDEWSKWQLQAVPPTDHPDVYGHAIAVVAHPSQDVLIVTGGATTLGDSGAISSIRIMTVTAATDLVIIRNSQSRCYITLPTHGCQRWDNLSPRIRVLERSPVRKYQLLDTRSPQIRVVGRPQSTNISDWTLAAHRFEF